MAHGNIPKEIYEDRSEGEARSVNNNTNNGRYEIFFLTRRVTFQLMFDLIVFDNILILLFQ